MAYMRYHDHVQQFDRITMDPEVMGGKPCIRGMRGEALAFAARLAQGADAPSGRHEPDTSR
jgi:uncharacterized protein (DUF433 family)